MQAARDNEGNEDDALDEQIEMLCVVKAIEALERVQKGRIWFEPYSDCLGPICAAIDALETLAGYDAVFDGGGDPMSVRRERP